jgi:DNA-directed RNA polymerase subunit beta'
MAVHLPLSIEAQLEAQLFDDVDEQHFVAMQSGKPIIVPSQDIVLGLYYMSFERWMVKKAKA